MSFIVKWKVLFNNFASLSLMSSFFCHTCSCFTDKMNSKGESNPSDSELGVRNPAFTDEVDGTLTKRRKLSVDTR